MTLKKTSSPIGKSLVFSVLASLFTFCASNVYAQNKFFPDGYKTTQVMKTCMYTNTSDENFILDFLPGYNKDVVIATGFSGHGFKFASVVGEIMSDLAIKGNTALPIGFLNAMRFTK